MIPRIALGLGFFSSKVKSHRAPVYPVDVSNGMPIISNKNVSIKKHKTRNYKIKKNYNFWQK